MSETLCLPKHEQPSVLNALEVRLLVDPLEIQRWNDLVCKHHYLQNANLVGEQLRYTVMYQGQWVALLGWSAASFHLKDRERWLGWSNLQRRARFHLLAQNSRFVVLTDRGDWPNLASRSLKLVSEQLSQDWQRTYGHPIAAVESFVDSQLFRGTAYKASNWILLGKTNGFGRVAEDFYVQHDRPKQLWVKSLEPDGPALLSSEVLPDPWCQYEKALPIQCGISAKHLPSLLARFGDLIDSRKGQGKRHRLRTIFAIIACAKLSGKPGGHRAIYNYAQTLTKPQRRALHCWTNPHTGEYEVPSESSFYRALKTVTPQQIQAVLDPWLDQIAGPADRGELVAMDGKTLNHSGVHLVSAITMPSLRCLGVKPVASKTNEITALRDLLDPLDLDGRLVEMDALHTQDETVQKILYEKGADYIVTLKDNQPTLLATAQNLLPQDTPPQVVIIEDNRSRRERRTISVCQVTPEQMGLAGAAQLAKIERTRTFTSPSFVADHILQPDSLAAKLATPKDALSKALRAALSAKVRKKLFTEDAAEVKASTPQALARALNKLAKGPSLYDPVRFPDKILSPETLALKGQTLQGNKLAQFNRLLLADAFREEICTAPQTETIWVVTSREASRLGAEEFLNLNRQYWGIENAAHQRLDCSAMEDRLRVRNQNAATVLGLLHRMSLTLFMVWAKTQKAKRDRTYPTWQSRLEGRRWWIIRQITEAPG